MAFERIQAVCGQSLDNGGLGLIAMTQGFKIFEKGKWFRCYGTRGGFGTVHRWLGGLCRGNAIECWGDTWRDGTVLKPPIS